MEQRLGNTKICSKCGEQKPLEQFGVNARYKDCRDPRCKDCIREYSRAYRDMRYGNLKDKVCKQQRNKPELEKTLPDGRSRWGCIEVPRYLAINFPEIYGGYEED